MRLIGRLLWMVLTLPAAIATGTFALLIAATLDPVMAPFTGVLVQALFFAIVDAAFAVGDPDFALDAAGGLGRLAFSILVLPPLFVALTAEVVGARGLLWHAGGTGLLTGAVPWLLRAGGRVPTPDEAHITLVLVLVGAVTGFIYWLIGGQWSGRPKPSLPPLPRTELPR